MAQENTHNEKIAELAKHKDAHIVYWKAHNGQTDPKRFEDGFIQGWCDAENKEFPNINRDSMLAQRKGENIAHCGNSPQEWAFEHGYHEGFDARRCMAPKPAPPQENTHEQKMAEMCKHKDGHVAYWKAHGNRPTDPKRFEDGFIQGWCDCEHHLGDKNMNANSLMSQRHQEHVKCHGDSPCEWAFDDGYREGWEGRNCMKPPQKPAAPPTTEPPKVSDCPPTPAPPVNVTPVPPVMPQQPPAPQWPAKPAEFPPAAEPPKVSDCPPTPTPPVTVAPVIPPANPPQPPAPQQPPKPVDCPPADAPPKPTTAPVPGPPATPSQPPAPTEPPKVANCPPTQASTNPTAVPVPVPPANPQQPPAPTAPSKPADCLSTGVPAKPTPAPAPAPPPTTQQSPAPTPAKPADCPPGTTTMTQAPPSSSAPPAKPAPPPTTQQNPAPTPAKPVDCGTSKQTAPAVPAPPPADNHCHTPAADLPANHQCTSECNHGKHEGILNKIEHALHLK